MKNKYSAAFKLKVVREIELGQRCTEAIARHYKLDSSTLYLWHKRYEYHGESAFSDCARPRRIYPDAFKRKVLRTMEREQLTVNETISRFKISNNGTIRRWQAWYTGRNRRPITARQRRIMPKKPTQPTFRPSHKLSAEQLIKQQKRELEYLRAENAYLKKLDALMREENQTTDKKRL